MPAPFRRLPIRADGSLLGTLSISPAGEAGPAALALLALAVALADGPEWLLSTLALLALAATVGLGWERRRVSINGRSVEPTGSYVLSRVLIVLATVVALSSERATERVSISACGALLGLALLAELVVSALGRIASPYAANLPGINVRNYPLFAE
jgi:hypothetical protein